MHVNKNRLDYCTTTRKLRHSTTLLIKGEQYVWGSGRKQTNGGLEQQIQQKCTETIN